ncbi:hypothetical protein B566_EDAN008064 [Ephemera danica]|nr:hypothetical protein B566_EDAN008064 [Ephemera danica]
MHTDQAILVVLATLFLLQCVNADVPRIKEIKSGPNQHSSGTPLVNLGDGFYYFETNVKANWYGAQEFCRNIGLHLAAVETEAENTLITDYIANLGFTDYWIGGSDESTAQVFVWTATGERVVYGNWHVGEPNGSRGDAVIQYRLKDGYFKWNDEDPSVQLNFICERYCDSVCSLP